MVVRQALARQWRPTQVDQVIGQSHVVSALSYMLEQQNIHQAILLTGTRGVGKTTLGRIMARSVSCEQGITASPCGQCYACQHIKQGSYTDLIEIDAASRTKVEDTRDLLEQTHYQPSHGRYKIFLIDEVHMLSNHSFNALLKTIEEPPKHVLFILATTDPDKLPETILSRCLHFQLHRMQPHTLFTHLQSILNQEKIEYEPKAIELIVHHAQGSVRDALTLCDQLIAQGQGRILETTVVESLGLLPQDTVMAIIEAAAQNQAQQMEQLFQSINQHHIQWPSLLNSLSQTLHQLACAHAFPHATSTPEIKALSQKVSPEMTQLFYQITTLGQQELNLAPSHDIGGQMVLLRMMQFAPELPKKQHEKISQPASQPSQVLEKPSQAQQVQKHQPKSSIQKVDHLSWDDCLTQCCAQGMMYQCFKNSTRSEQGQVWTIEVPSGQMAMLTQQLQQRFQQNINDRLNQPIQLNIVSAKATVSSSSPKSNDHSSENIAHLKAVFSDN
ncbi:MAG: DNA polymerase III subunit gamma/tau [Candidatus Comchoanobacterales bacterium]